MWGKLKQLGTQSNRHAPHRTKPSLEASWHVSKWDSGVEKSQGRTGVTALRAFYSDSVFPDAPVGKMTDFWEEVKLGIVIEL